MIYEHAEAWSARDHLAARVVATSKGDLAAIARTLTRRSNGCLTSRKNDASIPWRHRVERDLMRIFELDHKIISYEAMPEKVEFVLDGRQIRVVPSVRAKTVSGPMVFDVVRTDEYIQPARRAVIAALKDIFAQRGTRYCCLKPCQVRIEPRMSNVSYARSYKDVEPDQESSLRILDVISAARHSSTVATVREALGTEANGLFHMAMCRTLRLDLSASEPASMRISMGEDC